MKRDGSRNATKQNQPPMSQLGHKRKSVPRPIMSAPPPKAEVRIAQRDVRYIATATMQVRIGPFVEDCKSTYHPQVHE